MIVYERRYTVPDTVQLTLPDDIVVDAEVLYDAPNADVREQARDVLATGATFNLATVVREEGGLVLMGDSGNLLITSAVAGEVDPKVLAEIIAMFGIDTMSDAQAQLEDPSNDEDFVKN